MVGENLRSDIADCIQQDIGVAFLIRRIFERIGLDYHNCHDRRRAEKAV